MKPMSVYVLDLTKIEGSGEFSCPRCGNRISPDDVSEDSYSILEPKVNRHGLSEISIHCNKCSININL